MSQRQASDAYYMRLAVRISLDFGASIAIPAVAAALVGVRLDRKWDTEPLMLILLLVVAFLSTGVWIFKKAKYYKRLYEHPDV
ncbi:hypothetical protein A3B32_03095 [Candidatus Uhrbacteria bacterium RIFCSPLOWO2_01_FULL_53_9]|uniref:AtpZ/AtpI family protein n=3 Tax=Candidatus Uhriibacteriota TaxID=1752732 RepID=A0A1F7V046_9BACT|nr:MAG: hypothetical protein A3C17_01415 [Candidatus Uhrbacteria bacterium RIFCSPHIGHO2_02_FULL_53_13]OGL83364.1 MAG: hypothetical protein A3B32_03095 [Candidatus Uhrbacteria bacterium RIFCSPLOWO2_01_FULL_53_9]OGL89144.1 MAG: hypothetical protein A3I45_03090 [Candidatus Uhrbacteria bacterium RIFCSPLOWO2_02_FULL_53_10]